ncbi:hypothetical protein ONV78_03560 [Hahella sp. CR1]|uniref:HIT domain-containing protein n=1 Tax=Hahella sp. CR1 TaxID=2992807 RepID=UPI002441E0D0|nr:HIT domain-containing protein [Hahella sp. CR1]MDG9666801.1 hypothetical protein [Hahella sp. CR1]
MIAKQYIVLEAQHWVVNHRMGATYPGYLMAASRYDVTDLSELETDALSELGIVLARMERTLKQIYQPYKVLISKLGFSPGFNCHFHIVPVHAWVLREIERHPDYANEPDGNDVMLYVNRVYGENQCPEAAARVALAEAERFRGVVCREGDDS